jgi:hypothetical protein
MQAPNQSPDAAIRPDFPLIIPACCPISDICVRAAVADVTDAFRFTPERGWTLFPRRQIAPGVGNISCGPAFASQASSAHVPRDKRSNWA